MATAKTAVDTSTPVTSAPAATVTAPTEELISGTLTKGKHGWRDADGANHVAIASNPGQNKLTLPASQAKALGDRFRPDSVAVEESIPDIVKMSIPDVQNWLAGDEVTEEMVRAALAKEMEQSRPRKGVVTMMEAMLEGEEEEEVDEEGEGEEV